VVGVVETTAKTSIILHEILFLFWCQPAKSRAVWRALEVVAVVVLVVSGEIVDLNAKTVEYLNEGGHGGYADVVDFHCHRISDTSRGS